MFYENLDKQLVKDKKISSYLNVLAPKVESTDTVPTTLSAAYCSNLILPTPDGQSSTFVDIIPVPMQRMDDRSDVFDCRIKFTGEDDNSSFRAVLTTSLHHRIPIKNMRQNDALLFVAASGQKKSFVLAEATTEDENLYYAHHRNAFRLGLHDLRWFAENNMVEIRIVDMTMHQMYPHSVMPSQSEKFKTMAGCFVVALNLELVEELAKKEKISTRKIPELDIEHHFHHDHRIWNVNDIQLATKDAALKYRALLSKDLTEFKDSILHNIALNTEIGIAFFEQHKYDAATDYFNKALQLIDVQGIGASIRPQIETMLAEIAYRNAALNKASQLNIAALDWWNSMLKYEDEWDYVFRTFMNQAKVLQALDFSEDNFLIFKKSVPDDEQDWKAAVIQQLGKLIEHPINSDKSTDYNLAYLLFQKAGQCIDKLEKHQRVGREVELMRALGQLFYDVEDWKQAKKYFKKGLQLIDNHYDSAHPMRKQMQHMLSQVALQEADLSSATAYLQQTLGDKKIDDNLLAKLKDELAPIHLLQAITTKGIVSYRQNNSDTTMLKAILSEYEVASKLLKQMRLGHNNLASDHKLVESTDKLSQHAIVVCNELYTLTNETNFLEKAFNYAELSKGSISYELAQALQKVQGVPTDLCKKEENLRIQMAHLKEQISYELQQGKTQDKAKIEGFRKAMQVLQQEHSELLDYFKEHYPDYYRLKFDMQPVRLSDLQATLQDNEVFLQYTATDSFLHILIIDQHQVIPHFQPLDMPLQEASRILLYALKLNKAWPYFKYGYWLYENAIKCILPNIEGKKLIIAPDAQLYYIPFGTLPTQPQKAQLSKDKAYTEGAFLIEDFSICYNLSATAYCQSKATQKNDSKYAIAAFAPHFESMKSILEENGHGTLAPLPGAEKEAKAIAAYFGYEAFVAQAASEAKFKALANKYSVLHIATHGLLNDRRPLYSSLVLSNEANEDGLLNAWELYEMKLTANMAVLSACNSGMGQLSKAEGIVGVSSGFAFAGVPNIVMSKWPVSDWSTQVLMRHFYQYLKDGMPKDEALQKAKIQFLTENRRRPKALAPYYWGAFVLRGNTSPLYWQAAGGFYAYYCMLGGAVLLLLFVVMYRRKKQCQENKIG